MTVEREPAAAERSRGRRELIYLVAAGVALLPVPAAVLIGVAMALFFALPYRPPGSQGRGG